MSGSKRARPLGYAEGAGSREPSAKVLKEDTVAIYESTLSKLKLGAARAAASTTGGNLRANASSFSQVGKQQQQQQHGCENGSNRNGVLARCQMQQGLVRVASDSAMSMNGVPITTIQRKSSPCPCYVCVARESASACFHCSRGCCQQCSRRCEGCQELFCSICSTSNYNERYDRIFCFDCNTKASCNQCTNLRFQSICNDEAMDMDWL